MDDYNKVRGFGCGNLQSRKVENNYLDNEKSELGSSFVKIQSLFMLNLGK